MTGWRRPTPDRAILPEARSAPRSGPETDPASGGPTDALQPGQDRLERVLDARPARHAVLARLGAGPGDDLVGARLHRDHGGARRARLREAGAVAQRRSLRREAARYVKPRGRWSRPGSCPAPWPAPARDRRPPPAH